MMKRKKKKDKKKAAYSCFEKNQVNIKTTQAIIINLVLFLKMIGLHELQCKLKKKDKQKMNIKR